MVNHVVARVLDQFGLDAAFARRWDGQLHSQNPVSGVRK
jgi:3-polyprenyl-4-hydroxybenzoate decarboxylase